MQRFFAEIREKNKLKKLVGKKVEIATTKDGVKIVGVESEKAVLFGEFAKEAVAIAFVENTKTLEHMLVVSTKDCSAQKVADFLNEKNLKITTKTQIVRT